MEIQFLKLNVPYRKTNKFSIEMHTTNYLLMYIYLRGKFLIEKC